MSRDHQLTYVIGQPGSGKTTFINALTNGWMGYGYDRPFAHIAYDNGVVQLGKARAEFGGTDALSMSVQPKVLSWLEDEMEEGLDARIFGEGDRLGNAKFFNAVQALGYALTVVYLWVPADVAAKRCAERGSKQNDTWLRGRQTKIRNLVGEFPNMLLDGTEPVDKLLELAKAIPVLRRF